MARRFLLLGAVAWLVVAAAALVIAITGRDALIAALPPLSIDADAVGGALTAVAAGCAAIGFVHLWLVAGLRHAAHRPRTVGVLLASILCVAFVALAAGAAASAARETELAPWLWIGCVASSVTAIGYGWTAAELVGQLRSGSAV